jgi:hypothetical protein
MLVNQILLFGPKVSELDEAIGARSPRLRHARFTGRSHQLMNRNGLRKEAEASRGSAFVA